MSAHTPGPLDWQTVSATAAKVGHVYLIDAGGRKIASLWGRTEEKMANAALYAASPDMLAKMQRVIAWLEAQAKRDEDAAKDGRFPSLDAARIADAKNYRAMAADLRTALPEPAP